MTLNELQAALAGLATGVTSMGILCAYWAGQGANRAATEAETAAKQAAGDHFLAGFRLHRIKQQVQAVRDRGRA